jgi:ribosomal protein S18 acetylase RimI-like enzyme
MKANYPYRVDEENGVVYAWFTRMEYRGGEVTSDLEPELVLFEDKHYDVYQKVGNEIFADLLRQLHSSILQFFPLEEVQKRETYLWFKDNELVGSVRVYHDRDKNCYEIERLMVALHAQGKGYGARLLRFMVAKLQETQRTPIVLTVAACNENAIKIYEKFGFATVSEDMDEWKIEGAIC